MLVTSFRYGWQIWPTSYISERKNPPGSWRCHQHLILVTNIHKRSSTLATNIPMSPTRFTLREKRFSGSTLDRQFYVFQRRVPLYITRRFQVMLKFWIFCFIRIINRKWLHKIGKSGGFGPKAGWARYGINFTKKILSPGYFLDYDLLPVAASSRFVLFEDL